MENTASHLKGIEKLSEPEIEGEWNDHDCDHDQTGVPSFRYVVLVVEDGEGGDHVGKDGWRSGAGEAPCTHSDPSCFNASVMGVMIANE